MKNLVRMLGNAALVVGGFFVVLFGTSRMSNQSAPRDMAQLGGLDGVAHADVPYSQASYGGDSAAVGGDSGGDSGDSGDSK